MKARVHTQSVDHPEIASAVAGIVTLVLHYSGDNPLSPEAMGLAVGAVALPVVMFLVRIAARLIAAMPDDEAASE